jgi:transcriptional regulator NrdR family protein
MKCVKCGGNTQVTTVYQNADGGTRRRRECTVCHFRFTTREYPSITDPKLKEYYLETDVDTDTPPVV